MKRLIALAALAVVAVSGCTSSTLLVGNRRPETSPKAVKVYYRQPAKFEEIAIVDTDSTGSLAFTGTGRMNLAVERAKKEAAKVGANGLLIRGTGDAAGAGVVTGGANNGVFIGTAAHSRIKTFSAVAIWVERE
jgi:hypothetical protein